MDSLLPPCSHIIFQVDCAPSTGHAIEWLLMVWLLSMQLRHNVVLSDPLIIICLILVCFVFLNNICLVDWEEIEI